MSLWRADVGFTKHMISPASASARAPRRFSNGRLVSVFLGVLPLVALLFYVEEDWRGQRAWEMCKRDLAAKGQILEAESLIPPRVPDEQNILKAPKMGDCSAGDSPCQRLLRPIFLRASPRAARQA
jgi:hypothetical protein